MKKTQDEMMVQYTMLVATIGVAKLLSENEFNGVLSQAQEACVANGSDTDTIRMVKESLRALKRRICNEPKP